MTEVPTSILVVACVAACTIAPAAGSVGEEVNEESSTGAPGPQPDTTTTGEGTDEDGASTSTGEEVKFDLAPSDVGGCGGAVGHSYIWIANSTQGTVSKINTSTVIEEARYLTRPDGAGDPSRTSVALSGSVAVANRSGGLAKFYGDAEACPDDNGVPGIQTSNGPGDIMPWGTDECLAWYAPFPYPTQRPVAWVQGSWNESECRYEGEKLWTAGGFGDAEVLLVDGDTGVVEQTVPVAIVGWKGLYGGAVDGDGNFWLVDHDWVLQSTLIRVDRDDFEVHRFPVTADVHYGLAVDPEGRAWLCGGGGASRFDPVAEVWDHLDPIDTDQPMGGCMTDGAGILWHGVKSAQTIVGIDTESLQVVHTLDVPSYVHGISIDFEGYVWGVEFSGNEAFRVDPSTGDVDTVGGLVGAYTYSDMTGFALSVAGTPSG